MSCPNSWHSDSLHNIDFLIILRPKQLLVSSLWYSQRDDHKLKLVVFSNNMQECWWTFFFQMALIAFLKDSSNHCHFFFLGRFEGVVFGMYNGNELGWIRQLKNCYELKIWDDTRCWEDGMWVWEFEELIILRRSSILCLWKGEDWTCTLKK